MDLAAGVDIVGTRGDRERELLRIRRDRLQGRLQPYGRLGNRTRLKEFEHLELDRNPAQRLKDELDVARRRHDRRMMHAMVRQPGEIGLRQPCLELQVLTWDTVADQWTLRIFALPDEHLVVAMEIHRRPFFPKVSGEAIRYGLRTGILGREVQGNARLEQCAQSGLKADADVRLAGQRRNAGRHRAATFQTLGDGGLKRAVRRDFQHHVWLNFSRDRLHRGSEPHRLADI